jgi:hypothetical protein
MKHFIYLPLQRNIFRSDKYLGSWVAGAQGNALRSTCTVKCALLRFNESLSVSTDSVELANIKCCENVRGQMVI